MTATGKQTKTKLNKNDKKLLDEINHCWNQKEIIDKSKIDVEKLLEQNPDWYIKNIEWYETGNTLYPYHYLNSDMGKIKLAEVPYMQIDLKAYREGNYYFYNNKLFIKS